MMISYDVTQILEFTKKNTTRGWQFGSPGKSAKERLTAEGAIVLSHSPKFSLDREAPIFTVGSCFARTIENVLAEKNFPLVLRGFGSRPEAMLTWDETSGMADGVPSGLKSRGSLNKYSVHSMSHELKRILLNEAYLDEGLIELAPDKWFDPHGTSLKLAPYKTALENRADIKNAMAQIKHAKVVIMTLGLTETWLDNETGLAINELPGAQWLVRLPKRWKFVDYGFSDILETLETMIKLIRDHCCSEMKFIVTVSPVPLGATGKPQDVIVANSGSKSVLRAVAEELFRKYDFIDYFPSFEYVMYSPRSFAWREDQLHVKKEMVEAITSEFVRKYYS